MRRFHILALALALALASSTLSTPASASAIGVSFSADGTDCEETIQPFQQFTFYILAYLYVDAAIDGITGAEFQVRNYPAGWFGTPTPNPLPAVAIGNPLTGGCNIAFATCQTGSAQKVLLYTVTGFSTSLVNNVLLLVDQHTTPSSPLFPCPRLILCDAPVFGAVCVPGGRAGINNSACICCTAVETKAWSAVKSLYGSN